MLSNKSKWICPICLKEGDSSTYVKATRQITLKTLPQILFIQLKRFTYSEGFPLKLSNEISYPLTLEVQGTSYGLKSVIHHNGTSLINGHYTATILGSDGKWYETNDTEVKETTFDTMKDNRERQAYILLYEKEKQLLIFNPLKFLKNMLYLSLLLPRYF